MSGRQGSSTWVTATRMGLLDRNQCAGSEQQVPGRGQSDRPSMPPHGMDGGGGRDGCKSTKCCPRCCVYDHLIPPQPTYLPNLHMRGICTIHVLSSSTVLNTCKIKSMRSKLRNIHGTSRQTMKCSISCVAALHPPLSVCRPR